MEKRGVRMEKTAKMTLKTETREIFLSDLSGRNIPRQYFMQESMNVRRQIRPRDSSLKLQSC